MQAQREALALALVELANAVRAGDAEVMAFEPDTLSDLMEVAALSGISETHVGNIGQLAIERGRIATTWNE